MTARMSMILKETLLISLVLTLVALGLDPINDMHPVWAKGNGNPNPLETSSQAGQAGAGSSSANSHEYADFNNDGFDDLAIGANFEDVGTKEDAGAVNVLYGSSSGLQTSSPADQFWNQNSPGVEDAAEDFDVLGETLAAGDFNNDGYYDLAIGVPVEDIEAVDDAGAVNVLYGSSSGLQTSSPADQFWNQNSPGVEDTVEHGDAFGSSLVAGDFNNDGFDDLAIGVPGEAIGTRGGAGAVNVLYGSSSGLQTSSPADQFWNQNSPGVEDSAESLDAFGSSLAAGDFNGDSFADLAIGAGGLFIGEDIAGAFNAGAVNVLYGSSSGLQTSSPADQFWNQNSPGVLNSAKTEDEFGSSLAAGDFNGDSFADLAIGVPGEVIGTAEGGGAVNVLYGSSSGLQTSSPADQFWNQNSPGVLNIAESSDDFGDSLAAGDFNNDGFDDLAIGVEAESIGTVDAAGAVNVLYGSSSGLQASSPADQFWHQGKPGIEDAEESFDRFGSSLVAGDFNNDGFDDLAIGVPQEDIGTVEAAGAVNVLYGSSSGLQTSSPADQFWNQNSPGVEDAAEDFDLLGKSLA